MEGNKHKNEKENEITALLAKKFKIFFEEHFIIDGGYHQTIILEMYLDKLQSNV